MENPAEHLVGTLLDGGWLVVEKMQYSDDHSGGNFSICYKVRRENQIAFLKAVDISRAFHSKDRMKALQILTNAYEYEKELLEACDGKKMDRVVRILASGEVIPVNHNPHQLFVPYLIFELAETTIREHVLQIAASLDNACLMRSLHHVAVAIWQLHGAGIAHQDLKGSNVLLFNINGSSKVADLGSAEINTKRSVKYNLDIAGDPDYAPPEQILGHKDEDWNVRRKATDLYHLGSLISFYYTQITMTAFYESHLPAEFKRGEWKGQYGEALPIMKLAFQEILETIEAQLEETFSEKDIVRSIMKLVKYLCDPDPSKRGHPDSLPIDQYSMERFISIFDNLANKFESKLL